MEQRLKLVFEKLNIQIDQNDLIYFNNACILGNISVSTVKEKAYLTIQVEKTLPIALIKELDDKFKNAKVKTKIQINTLIPNYDPTLIWEYINFIKTEKATIKTSTWEFIEPKYATFNEINQQLEIVVDSKSKQKVVEAEILYLSAKMRQYGFAELDIISNLIEPGEDFLTQQEEVFKQLAIQERQQQNQIENAKEVKTFNNNSFRTFAGPKLDTPSYSSLLDLEENANNIVIHVQIMNMTIKISKTGRKIYSLNVTDHKTSIKAIYFAKDEGINLLDPMTEDEQNIPDVETYRQNRIQAGDWIALKGRTSFSQYDNETIFAIDNFQKINRETNIREDNAEKKRVELHVHTKMSVMDGVSDVSDYIKRADKWNWPAIAITDHTNVQSFPDAFATIKSVNKKRDQQNKSPLKLIYGSEITVLDDELWYVKNPTGIKLKEAKFVVFDLETTGLSPEFDEIIEFGAVVYNYKNGERKRVDYLIKPEKPLKAFTKELTGITDEMLEDKPTIEEIFPTIYDLIKDGILVAHNASFDFNFLNSHAQKLGYPELKNTVIDTLSIARSVYPTLKNYRLGTVAKKTGIIYDDRDAHRADYDADILIDVYEHIWNDAKKMHDIITDQDWNMINSIDRKTNANFTKTRGFHATVLAKNQTGLKDLYKLISYTHTESLMGSPKIFKSELLNLRDKGNLLIGTSCANGEIFDLARTNTLARLDEKIRDYDYVEIQPISVYKNLLQNDSLDLSELQRTIKIIIEAALKNNKLLVASSDTHYLDPELKLIREIYINSKGLGGVNHPLYDFKKRVKDYPDQHLRTTQEMLDEFEWLNDEQLVQDIVINNTNKIADMIDHGIEAVKSGTFDPQIENVDQLLKDKCYEIAEKTYGNPLPKIVADRLERELNSIIKHGFAVVYWISHKLVEKSINDGYLVGSRGSVGSSFVAWASNVTEVNPLKAHYRCLNCQYSDFETPPEYNCGYDLPIKNCLKCNTQLIGDGHDIPFETFLGFDGDKVPDIDLNFSGEYQAQAHNFTKEMFGENNVFRAGTISTVADKTAFGYVKNFLEEHTEIEQPRRVEIERLASLATGVKRTTGQHPGGIIILPKEFEIEDFTPVNFPADDNKSTWKTTHFDFHSIHDNLLKMDILGHVDPTALKMLRDLTGVDPVTIPTNDPKVYALFSNLNSLNITPNQINNETTGAIGIPEFGTQFVRGMLRDTKPKSFADLVQISGLSHGTDVWLGNAQNLIKNGLANISTVIGCRDDIMVYLMRLGLEPSLAFNIMESVRKGKGLKAAWIEEMRAYKIPEWYIESCQKIKYMFPKAHATAYVLMAYRIAWYKIYYPEEYYAIFFSTRSNAFDLKTSLLGYNAIVQKLRELEVKAAKKETTAKENDLITTFEVQMEMLSRGIKMENIDFNKSLSTKFLIEIDEHGNKILYPPFNVIDSLGETAAESIVDARKVQQFSSVQDLKNRTQITQTQMKIFEDLKIVDSLSNDEQLAFEF
ncbi:PolC-type DNA polymerase III [Williamsoniiplasma luminosum]|uniref:DNA polymerase III PolC-type n=1 Tax=Williamsoniiplasma luminosum TaxID=214888 RepID=A0A2S0NJ50_9MOLU|nr:PolC-type DNA polymerase III [Williamsoniiplasma luminosum]AVP49036.1 MAG: PolC-type DNA polymerase III [Williamsoniiplasma luminosum]